MLRPSSVIQRLTPEYIETSRAALPGAAEFADEHYQLQILPLVSRTFALTIPQLPPPLRSAVTTAYLLCRIADTIEDEPAISADAKLVLLDMFAASVRGGVQPEPLAVEIAAILSNQTLPAERELVFNLGRVIRLAHRLSEHERTAIERCIEIMCRGMHHYQEGAGLCGLPRLVDLDGYCYCVAGVVGEMLSDLFRAHCADFGRKEPALHNLAASFGQGLQMTNILKDIWEDRRRGACWLPRDVFGRYGLELENLPSNHFTAGFAAALRELVGLAHAHLHNGFAFTLAIPPRETGIRRFCLLALGLALLTLRKICRYPTFTIGAHVKIKRGTVFTTKLLTDLAVQNDRVLQMLFRQAAYGLPLEPVSPQWEEHLHRPAALNRPESAMTTGGLRTGISSARVWRGP
jgi:farnesyl-diphosphate farnesyltransferase